MNTKYQHARPVRSCGILTCLAAVLGLACGEGDSPVGANTGSSGGALEGGEVLPDVGVGELVGYIDYILSRSGEVVVRDSIPLMSGVVPEGRSGTMTMRFDGLPSGGGYAVHITAVDDEHGRSCSGRASFAVADAAVASVDIGVACSPSVGVGDLDVDGGLNQCPEIAFSTAVPLETFVGRSVAVAAAALDHDGQALMYRWAANGVDFSTRPSSAFACTIASKPVLTFWVSDGICEREASIQIQCHAEPRCGNAVVEFGEGCDPPNSPGCGPDCQLTGAR